MVASEEARKAEFTLSREDFLEPDTMELVLYAVPTARFDSLADVTVRFFSLQAEPIRGLRLEAGKAPFARFEAVQAGEVPFIGGARGVIGGCERTIRKSVGGDVLTEGFSFSREDRAIEFELSLSAEDYARFTDIAVQVVDQKGRAVAKAGFGARVLRLRLDNPEPGRDEASYRLEIRAGRALAGGPSFEIAIRSLRVWNDPIPVRVTLDGQEQFRLYPGVPGSLEMRAASTPKAIPPDHVYSGAVEFVSARDRTVWLRVPIRASLQQ